MIKLTLTVMLLLIFSLVTVGQSAEDLVFVGKIDGYARDYGSKCDGTDATFRVLRVLKGKYFGKHITVRFSGHWGFNERIASIVFAKTNSNAVESGQSACESGIFVGQSVLDNTGKNIRLVERRLKGR